MEIFPLAKTDLGPAAKALVEKIASATGTLYAPLGTILQAHANVSADKIITVPLQTSIGAKFHFGIALVTGISNQALLARIALARASSGSASSGRSMFRSKTA